MGDEIGLFEAIYTQRAIRRLKPDPVPDDLIVKLIDAAIRAPSGGNRQPWNFLVIREPETKRKIGEWYLDAWNKTYGAIPQDQRDQMPDNMKRTLRAAEHLAHHLAEAPVFILVCARDAPPPNSPGSGAGHYGSIFPAVQNLLLAARGLGLGASLTTLHKLHEAEVKELLGIPESAETIALIPIGYPRGKYGPTTRLPVERVTYWERWEGTKDG
jgi:nitroreductase